MISKRERYMLLLSQHLSPTARRANEALSTAQLVKVAEELELGDARPLDLSAAVLADVSAKLQTAVTLGGISGGIRCWNRVWPEAHTLVTSIIAGTADEAAGTALMADFEKTKADLLEPPASCTAQHASHASLGAEDAPGGEGR